MSRQTTATKRIMKEIKELHKPTAEYYAAPLEDNIFEWHFTIRGPPETAFEGGRYHGRITLPLEYPLKPPSIMLLTPNGRFEVGKKICLSISAHHPESWQPSWSIRTVLIALIGFLPTEGNGAVASLDYTPRERKKLAIESRKWCCKTCEADMRTALPEDAPVAARSEADLAALEQLTFKGEEKKRKQISESEVSPSAKEGPTETVDAPPKPPKRNKPLPPAPFDWQFFFFVLAILAAIGALLYRKLTKEK